MRPTYKYIFMYAQATSMNWNDNPYVYFTAGQNLVTFDAREVSSILKVPMATEQMVDRSVGKHNLFVVYFKNGHKEHLCIDELEGDLDDIIWPDSAELRP